MVYSQCEYAKIYTMCLLILPNYIIHKCRLVLKIIHLSTTDILTMNRNAHNRAMKMCLQGVKRAVSDEFTKQQYLINTTLSMNKKGVFPLYAGRNLVNVNYYYNERSKILWFLECNVVFLSTHSP